MPREGRFFEYFNEHAEQLVLGAAELKALMSDISELQIRARNIESTLTASSPSLLPASHPSACQDQE